jgi:LmbE family N-acetylglucosaminyl deacetylase
MAVPLVVVAAHPDDETVGSASLLLRARSAAVVHLTDGAPRDPRLWGVSAPDRSSYARLRRAEALAALAEAGVASERIVSLGAVDQEAIEVLAPLTRELAAVLEALEPRFVVSHPLEGGHPDHDAAAVAVRAALALLAHRGARPPRLAEMTSHHLAGERLAAGRFLAGSPRGIRHRLTAAEREIKRRMIECHASQRRALATFGLEEEAFRLAPPISLAVPPRAAPLHHEARGWMSFERFREAALEALRSLGLLDRAAAPVLDAGPRSG